MGSTVRVLLLACCILVAPASAELKLDLVESDDGAPLDAKPELGVKVRAGGGQGGTAMHWMAFNGDEAAARQLIISGADIDDRLKTGGTPLHLAAYNGHTGVARLLIEHGAQVNARTKAGVTPLDWAQRNGHEEVAKLLIAHGAKATKVFKVQSNDAARTGVQGSGREDPKPGIARRRQAPLKYSLFLVPEDTLAVNEDLKENKPTQAKTAPKDGYRIQLGAFSSEQRALEAWARYRKKHPKVLGSRELILDRASVKGKSFHRVQTGPMSRADAWGICDLLKQAGQGCAMVRRGTP